MTTPAERIKAANRGFRAAAPASASRIAALKTFGLRYTEIDDMNVLVEDSHYLNLAMSFWRAIDGSTQGYLVSALADEIRRNSEKPVTGRDSGAAFPSRPPKAAVAESVAGPGSSSRLPEVNPWP